MCYILALLWAEFGYSPTGTAIYQEDKIMTPKELYDWAAEMGAENYDIEIEHEGVYAFVKYDVEENQLSLSRKEEQLIIDI